VLWASRLHGGALGREEDAASRKRLRGGSGAGAWPFLARRFRHEAAATLLGRGRPRRRQLIAGSSASSPRASSPSAGPGSAETANEKFEPMGLQTLPYIYIYIYIPVCFFVTHA